MDIERNNMCRLRNGRRLTRPVRFSRVAGGPPHCASWRSWHQQASMKTWPVFGRGFQNATTVPSYHIAAGSQYPIGGWAL